MEQLRAPGIRLPEDIILYRKQMAAMKDINLNQLDIEVWREYINQHPIEDEIKKENTK